MVINTNMSAIRATRQLSITNGKMAESIARLSSGSFSAASDPAGSSISQKMKAQIRGLQAAAKNCQDGISLFRTAEGAMNEMHSMLQRIREIAVESANDTNTELDRRALNNEVEQLIEGIGDIAERTSFNRMNLLDGSFVGKKLHTGANYGETLNINIASVMPDDLGISGMSVLEQADAEEAVNIAGEAIGRVSENRSYAGAMSVRLEHTINYLDNAAENLMSAESRISGVDIAKEMMNYAKLSILQQATMAMIAQSNQNAQSVLQLLRI